MAKIKYRKPPRIRLAHRPVWRAYAANLAIETTDFEGYVPSGYFDPVGIPTKCWGDTTDVVVCHEYSFEKCFRSLNGHMLEIAHANRSPVCAHR